VMRNLNRFQAGALCVVLAFRMIEPIQPF